MAPRRHTPVCGASAARIGAALVVVAASLAASGAGTAVAQPLAEAIACAGPLSPVGRVAAAGPALGLTLDGGSRLALVDVMLPGAAGELAPEIAARLAALVGAEIAAAPTDAEPDRHGRLAVHFLVGGTWLAADLVAAGLLAVAPEAGPDCRDALAEAEAAARLAGRGLWQNGHGVLRADDPALANRAPDMVIVEGRIVSVGESRGRIYLNFGADWSVDFTVLVPEAVVAAFGPGSAALTDLAGREVRVRGWMVSDDGGLLELGAAAALELIGD